MANFDLNCIYLEIDGTVAVFVEDPEYLVDENFCIAHWKDHRVHVQNFILA